MDQNGSKLSTFVMGFFWIGLLKFCWIYLKMEMVVLLFDCFAEKIMDAGQRQFICLRIA